MFSKSMWWVFVLAFVATIGGIQSLGCWTKPFAPPAQVTRTEVDAAANPAALEASQGEPLHWRSLVMCQ